jgi:ABC-type glycerol-3-phosphate transport system substrate-binding protein
LTVAFYQGEIRVKKLLLQKCLLVLFLLLGAVTPLHAQGSPITLTLAVADFSRESMEKLVGEFEASHPEIKVKLVSAQNNEIPRPATNLDKYLEGMLKYVSSADVVFVDGGTMSTEATRAGYVLDLAPLVNQDQSLNPDEFYPAVWQSFQWDKGIWALPTGASTLVMTYSPSAFDKAGLAYPNEKWTLNDLVDAIRKLSQKDADGKVIIHGIDILKGYSDLALFRSLMGEGVYDPNVLPNGPQLDKPTAEALLDTWAQLEAEGLIGNDFNKAPMSIGPSFAAMQPSNAEQKREITLLPGGQAMVNAQGYAVSAGTQYPEQAYALVKFLTTRPQAAEFGTLPARKALSGMDTVSDVIKVGLPPEIKAISEKALNNGIPLSEMRYMDYVGVALSKMQSEKLNAKDALQAVEAQAVAAQQTAASKKGTVTIAVPTPVPSNLTAGKTTLNFGITSNVMPFPNREAWEKLVQDFTASDPQIGQINLNIGPQDKSEAEDKNDCFYLPYNAVPGAKLSSLLNLDGLLAADTTFDKADLVGNSLAQVQRENKTWALPIDITPSMLNYDADKFSKAGLPAPDKGWTVDSFKEALKVLKADMTNSVDAPFIARTPGGTHLLILIAVYGGLPLDYRTNPPTVHFTDPATVEAIRQVLDLAKQGYLKYEALGSVGNVFAFGGPTKAPIYAEDLMGLRILRGGSDKNPYRPTSYPRGTQFSGLSFSMGTAYISATAQNPDACYRWISTIAKHPELFSAMPARRSILNDPAFATLRGADMAAMYKAIDQIMQDPNTITFPSLFDGANSQQGFLLQHWLYEAFDSYVLRGADLDSALKDAESYARGFQDCVAGIPTYDPATQTRQQYDRQFLECAAKADQRLKSWVDGLN